MAEMHNKLKTKSVSFYGNNDEEDTAHEHEIFENAQDTGFDIGLSIEKLNLGPRKKLLVLINGLLIHRVYKNDTDGIPKHRHPDGKFGSHLVFKRPFSDEFLKFCLERFEVGIWSSSMEHNIDGVLECAMKGLRGKLAFVWDQRQCTDSGFKSLEKKDKPLFFKELRKLWKNKSSNFPWRQGQYSSSNTLMIDDKPYKALLNPPYTAIFPEPYNVEDVNDDALDLKGELVQFLEGLADASDVPTYVKEHPFGQPTVTPSHPYWEYYSNIIPLFHKGHELLKGESERKIKC